MGRVGETTLDRRRVKTVLQIGGCCSSHRNITNEEYHELIILICLIYYASGPHFAYPIQVFSKLNQLIKSNHFIIQLITPCVSKTGTTSSSKTATRAPPATNPSCSAAEIKLDVSERGCPAAVAIAPTPTRKFGRAPRVSWSVSANGQGLSSQGFTTSIPAQSPSLQFRCSPRNPRIMQGFGPGATTHPDKGQHHGEHRHLRVLPHHRP